MTSAIDKNAPKGIVPIWIQQKNLKTYGLAENETDPSPAYSLISKKDLLDDINKYGFMNDFNEYKALIRGFDGESILLVRDDERRFGEDWYFCSDVSTFESELKRLTEKNAEKEISDAPKIESEPEGEEMIEEYIEKPFVPRPWISSSENDTIDEVLSMTLKIGRPLIRVAMTRPRESFNTPVNFCDRNATEWITDEMMHKIGVKKYMEPAFNNYDPNDPDIKLQNRGCQIAPQCTEGSSQTVWHRKEEFAAQYEPLVLSEIDQKTIFHGSKLKNFLKKACPIVEEALQQNEAVDLFENLFLLPDTQSTYNAGKEGKAELKEIRTFTDLVHSKNREIKALQWVPLYDQLVAVAPVKLLPFDQRSNFVGGTESACILVWDFYDLINPVFKLEAPQQIICFKMNPKNPSLVVGGLISGQVAIWDVENIFKDIEFNRRKREATKRKSLMGPVKLSGNDSEKSDKPTSGAPIFSPLHISHIEMSHKKYVSDIEWLPYDSNLGANGKILESSPMNEKSNQFMSISPDGQCLCWDVRQKDTVTGKFSNVPHAAISMKGTDKQQAPLLPIFRVQLNRLEGVGELPLNKMFLQPGHISEVQAPKKSCMICSTEDGEILLADWQARSSHHSEEGHSGPSATSKDESNSALPEYVKWVGGDRCLPSVGLKKSPFFSDVFLLVKSGSFELWKIGVSLPIFNSPPVQNYYTAGTWSATRPSVLVLGKSDGKIEIWCMIESSYAPIDSISCSPSSIVSLEFSEVQRNLFDQRLLAVGDSFGNLHVYEVPQRLSCSTYNEQKMMAEMIEHEWASHSYVSERMKILSKYSDNDYFDKIQNLKSTPKEEGTRAVNTSAVSTADAMIETLADLSEAEFKKLEEALAETLGFNVDQPAN